MPRAYYNEWDKFAAAWLRELISAGLIMDGDVDTRSITDVAPADLTGYTRCHFFAGIGGWDLALQLGGWPEDRPVWTGSCPCQPFSTAGKGRGTDDERHLWPAFRKLLEQCEPAAVFGEQVASKAGRAWLSGVFADLEGMGYRRAGADLCAAGVGAPHIRQRLWWVADAEHMRTRQRDDGQQGEASGKRRGGSTDSGVVCSGLADRDSGRCEQRRKTHNDRRRHESGHDAGRRNQGDRGLGHAKSEQALAAEPGQQQLCHARLQRDGLGDGQREGLEGHAGHGDDGHEPGRQHANAHRHAAQAGGVGIVRCVEPTADGSAHEVWRPAPTEPALFPLAHGIPNRVGMLRGAGNAIIPQLAAEFVAAYLEAEYEGVA